MTIVERIQKVVAFTVGEFRFSTTFHGQRSWSLRRRLHHTPHAVSGAMNQIQILDTRSLKSAFPENILSFGIDDSKVELKMIVCGNGHVSGNQKVAVVCLTN